MAIGAAERAQNLAGCGRLLIVNPVLSESPYPTAMNPAPPVAVFWDYDGTLVDTQPIWLQVEKDLCAMYDATWTDELGHSATGISGIEAAKMIIDVIGNPDLVPEEIDLLRSTMVADRVSATALTYRPGAETLLEGCFELGIPCVLVSASPRFALDAGTNRMPSHWFSATISGDDISRQKPDPQGYLQAASLLGVNPADCLVIEDSVPGCTAGRASGASVLAIPSMTPLDPCPGQVVRNSLTEVSVEDLARIYAQARATLEY